ncbi:hypothetical protein JHK87_022561 [Glycine soja]|nr:hypothetical protein JHK87_022561 [Glycine soja]
MSTLSLSTTIAYGTERHVDDAQVDHSHDIQTRPAFDVAVKVNQRIQGIDKAACQNMGNFILQWLHKMKLLAQIQGGSRTNN